MTSMELLEIIGAVKDKYILEAHSDAVPQRKRLPLKKTLLIAAIIALMLLLVGCTIVIAMRLQEAKIGRYTYTFPAGEEESTGSTLTSDVISLQGFVGTPNYQATQEWIAFLQTYDPDGTLLKQADTDDFQEPIEYMSYTCYTQEMQDKIDEICAKYNLQLLGPTYLSNSVDQMLASLGIAHIAADTAAAQITLSPGYYYRDGTFSIPGDATLLVENAPRPYTIAFQYRCVMKTAFDGVALTVGDIESYDQWNYTLQDGTTALLALSPEKALIIVDKEAYFTTINILDPSSGEQQMNRAALETIADTFTFSYTPQAPDPDTLIEPEWFESDAASDPPFVRDSYQAVVSYILNNSGWTYDIYTLCDLNGDGIDELLLGEKDSFRMILTVKDGKTLPFSLFSGVNNLYLCESNIIEQEIIEPTIERHLYYRASETDAVIFDSIARTPEGAFLRSSDGGTSVFGWKTITEEEYNAVLCQYARIDAEMKSLSDFPADFSINTTISTNNQSANTDISTSAVPEDPGYNDVISYYIENYPDRDVRYSRSDFDGNGNEDIAIWYDGAYQCIYMMGPETVQYVWKPGNGFTICEIYVQNVNQVAYEGNILHIYDENDGMEYHVFARMMPSGTYIRECIRYESNGEDSKWASAVLESWDTPFYPKLWNLENWKPISEQEYHERLNDYQEMQLELKSISEYPMNG